MIRWDFDTQHSLCLSENSLSEEKDKKTFTVGKFLSSNNGNETWEKNLRLKIKLFYSTGMGYSGLKIPPYEHL